MFFLLFSTIEHHKISKKVPTAFKKSIQTVEKYRTRLSNFLKENSVILNLTLSKQSIYYVRAKNMLQQVA